MTNEERWLPFKTDPAYEVSDLGNIRNRKTGRVLKVQPAGHVELSGKSYRRARVVLEVFGVPKGSPTDVAIQIDPDKGFALENLKWGTKQEAAVDWTKLRDIQVLSAQGLSIAEICRRTGSDYYTVKHAAPHAMPAAKGQPWSDEKKRIVGQLVADGASLNDIMRVTGSDHRTIKKYFPNAGWTRGGAGAKLMRQANELLRKDTL